MNKINKVPKKYLPKGFDILHEDVDIIVVNKNAGILTVAAKWEQENTVHALLNTYVRRGNTKSNKCVYVVHRLDQATSGVLIFAKTEAVQISLKENWKTTNKIYYAIAHGRFEKKSGTISSYLTQDEDYVIHSGNDEKGKLAHTEYEVIKENDKYSLLKVNLITGRKNQIRVHLADEGHALLGDSKYGKEQTPYKNLGLHAYSIEFTHPHKKTRMTFTAPVPSFFRNFVAFNY